MNLFNAVQHSILQYKDNIYAVKFLKWNNGPDIYSFYELDNGILRKIIVHV